MLDLKALAEQGVAIADLLNKPSHNQRMLAEMSSRQMMFNDHPATEEDKREITEALRDLVGPSPFNRAFSVQMGPLIDAANRSHRGVKTALSLETHWMARWATCGLPVFSLTEDLAAALLLTDPPEFEPEGLQLPFPAFAVAVPQSFVPMYLGGERGSVTTICVHRMINNTPEARQVDCVHVSMDSDNGRRLYRLQPVDKLLREDATMLDLAIGDDPTRDIDQDNRTLAIGIRLVRNLIAWIEAHGTGSPEPRPRAKGYTRRQREAASGVWPTTWILGREVKLGTELRQMATDIGSGERREGWKLRVRYCVRGHWKWQVCGEGRRDRKRIFVAPYWKGPEGAAAWQHVYTAKETP